MTVGGTAASPPAKKTARLAGRIVLALVAALIIWSLIVMLFEERFIYFPSRYPDGLYDEAERLGIAEDCYFTTTDGVRIHGWFFRHDEPRATLLLFHGNAGNVSHRLPLCTAYRDLGYQVFIIDYRGYGRSAGEPSEEGLYRDADGAYGYLSGREDTKNVPLVIFGSSLGGAVAVDLGLRHGADAVILEATFTSAADVAAIHYPFLPVRMFLRTEFNSLEKIPGITAPVLFIHGEEDTIIPIDLGRRLFDAAGAGKEFHAIPRAGHNDLLQSGGARYLEVIDIFLRRHLPGGPRP